MRKFYLLVISCLLFITETFSQQQTKSFDQPGTYSWTAPCGVTSINVQAWGSGAGGNAGEGGGGGGAFSGRNNIVVTPGTIYTIIVGEGAQRGSGDDGQFSRFRLSANNLVAAEGGGSGSGNKTGGQANNSIGSIKFSGGNGGTSASGRGGAGGGGSAGNVQDGGDGNSNSGDNGGAAGFGGDNGGVAGGKGGSRYQSGFDAFSPGGGGGERGSNGSSSGAGGDGMVIISYLGITDYCSPQISNTEPITLVNLDGQINNSTSASTNSDSYESFCLTANVGRGNNYTIKVKGNTDGNYISYFTVFIDWNQDGDFNDIYEVNKIGTIQNSNGTDSKELNATIAVPAGATLGLTKMRVYKTYRSGGYSINRFEDDACATNTYGQVEDYTINVIGNCVQPTGAIVTDGTNSSATSLTVCSGTKVTLKQTGGTKGTGTWEWRSGSASGALVGTSTAADAELEITPSAATTTYYVHSTCGAGASASVTVVVNTNGTIALFSGSKDIANACKSAAITPIVFTVGGGANTASVTAGNLTASGLSGAYNATNKKYTISGTPNAAGTFTYTITAGGNSPCSNASLTGTITVSQGPGSLSYTLNTVTYCSNGPITANQPTVTGGAVSGYSVSPALPNGLNLNATTGFISGTPTTASAVSAYTVTASNNCGTASKVVYFGVSNGDQAFNVTPSGNQDICSGTSVAIGLSGSINGTSYQLFRNGSTVGSPVAGTGNAIAFSSQSAAGIYTVKSTSSCATNMSGSTTLTVTAQPTAQFIYPNYVYCKSGVTAAATISGSPATGVFTASPVGLIFDNTTTGVINLETSQAGTYTISYTVAAGGGCSIYTYIQPNPIKISLAPTVFELNGGGEYCQGTGGIALTLSSSQTGISYKLYRNNVATSTVVAGTGSEISFGNQTLAGTYKVNAYFTAGGGCATWMDGENDIIMNPKPAAILISPSAKTICRGEIVPLSVSYAPPTSASQSPVFQSGTINAEIPNNSATGVSDLLKVSGIPEGASITSVVMKFNVSHSYDGDLLINLKGPNGKVLNIANGIGGTGDNFSNTQISSLANNNISTYNSPYSSLYAPQGSIGVNGAQVVTMNVSNVASFAELFGSTATSANGNWTLSVRDKDDHGNWWSNEAQGYLNNWEITFNYTYTSNPAAVAWSPATDLFTDPGATVPYIAGELKSAVYARPSSTGAKVYTATSSNSFGCTSTSSTTVTVNASPIITVTANYCDYPGKVRITATSDIPVNNWAWSGGETVKGSGSYSRYIEPNTAGTFYVSARSTANSCAGIGEMSIAQELVVNGDFEQGNVGFTTDYNYVSNTTQNGLVPSGGLYTVNYNPNFNHANFWGADHTTADGNGNYMLINGTSNKVVWKETVTVIPGTTYYFSAYAVSLNDVNPFANLQFKVNGVAIGTSTGALPAKSRDNNGGAWIRFYGNWPSGTKTNAIIEIVDLQNAESGNDFGLDDISFATLSTFFNLTSAAATETQVSAICVGTNIADITYEVGGDGNSPSVISGTIPPGITTFWNGRNFNITGAPTTAGTFNFTLQSSGCNPKTKTIKIVVDQPSDGGTFANDVVSTCYNTNTSITLNNTLGSISQWQVSNDGGINWTTVAGTTNTLSVTGVTTARQYKAFVKNKSCSQVASPVVKVGVRNYWTGEKDRNFNDTKNWSDEAVPVAGGACPTVVIPAVTNLPILNSGNPNITNLQVNLNASLQITETGILGIAGTITNTGALNVKDGTLNFNGTISQSLSGADLKDRTIKNLIVSNTYASGFKVSAIANDTLNIVGALSFGTNASKLNSGNNITLKSSADATAGIGKLAAGNIITGTFVVERFINTGKAAQGGHRKSWQLLATPTSGQSIKDSWQEGATSTGTTPIINNKSGYGTLLTSGLSNAIAAGFDLYTAPGPSIKAFDPSTGSFDKGPTSTSLPLYNPNGYMVLVRGDRSVYLYNQDATATVLRSKGTLFTAQAGNTPPMINVPANTSVSVGNPYASAIDLRKITKSGGVNEFIFVWDPLLSGGYGLGGYVTLYKGSGGNYYATPSSGSYDTSTHNFIQSGQAFFVQSTGTAGSVSFNESVKESGSKLLMRPMGSGNRVAQLQTNLFGVSADGKAFIADGALVQYGDDFSNEIDGMDARKARNTSENLSILSMGKKLAVERRHTITVEDTIFLTLNSVQVQPYRYEFVAENLSAPGLEGWIEDAYLKTRTPLNLEGSTVINFKIENIPAAYAANRFRVVFKQAKEATTLTVIYASIKANQQNDGINVEWKVDNETVTKHYEVERSEDGINFTKVATVPARNRQIGIYNWLDQKPMIGYNYYRVRAVDINGLIGYTEIVRVKTEIAVGTISVYPNPITNGTVNLRLDNQPLGLYGIRITNPIGQTIMSKKITHTEGSSTEKIEWDYKLAHGMYQMEITKPNGDVHVIKVMY